MKKKNSWSHRADVREANKASPLVSRVSALLKTVGKEVNGVHLIATFIKRRVHPIQAREHPLYEYAGADEATRTYAEELSTGEVEARVCVLTMLKVGEPHVFDPPVTPFSAEHPVPEVIVLFCCLFLIFVSNLCSLLPLLK